MLKRIPIIPPSSHAEEFHLIQSEDGQVQEIWHNSLIGTTGQIIRLRGELHHKVTQIMDAWEELTLVNAINPLNDTLLWDFSQASGDIYEAYLAKIMDRTETDINSDKPVLEKVSMLKVQVTEMVNTSLANLTERQIKNTILWHQSEKLPTEDSLLEWITHTLYANPVIRDKILREWIFMRTIIK